MFGARFAMLYRPHREEIPLTAILDELGLPVWDELGGYILAES